MRTSVEKTVRNQIPGRVSYNRIGSGATGATGATSTDTRYTVLYYKRKNKVHRSKGVSKLDGTIVFVRSHEASTTLSVTLRSNDTGNVVYQGRMHPNGNSSGRLGEFNIDETLSVGAYEVEIISCDEDKSRTKNLNSSITSNAPTNSISSRQPLGPSDANIPSTRHLRKQLCIGSSNKRRRGGLGTMRPLVRKFGESALHAPSALEKKIKISGVDFVNNKYENTTPSPGAFSSTSSTPRNMLDQRNKIAKTTTDNLARVSANNRPWNRRRPIRPLCSRKNSTPSTTGDSQKKFPGAVGTLLVPNSIRKVLRPHQIEGVVFLWNCLTGNGQAANVSPHINAKSTNNVSDEMRLSDSGGKVVSDDDRSCNDRLRGSRILNSSPKGCVLSDEMGLGKTLMTIATIAALHRRNRTNRFVVVCPSSLVMNWAHEFDKWLGKVGFPKRVVVKKGGEEGIRQIKTFSTIKPSNISEVLILSYELFRTKATILESVRRVALLVVDEGHRLKNTSGSLTMTALESLPCEARLCITATPIQNNLGDMYTIFNFVCPGVLGDLVTFRREYERPITTISSKRSTCTTEEIRRGEESRHILERITQSLVLRRLQNDILKQVLPPRHVFLLFCQLTLQQRELYKNIVKSHGFRGVGKSVGSYEETLVALGRLRKVCTHPKLLQRLQSDKDNVGAAMVDSTSSGKLLLLQDIVLNLREKEPSDKVVIVSNYTSTLTVIEDAILKKLKLNFLRLDGSIKGDKRQSIVDTFNRTSAKLNFALTLSSKAGGVGLNLIGANRLIMVDPDWNPATDLQAMARIYREGQKKECFIYRCFTSGTIEEVILQRQIQKGSLASMTIDGARRSNSTGQRLNTNEIRDCFNLEDKGCACSTRLKVTNWPDYDGKASLVSQGCQDAVLLSVAAKEDANNQFLSFVHIVKNDDSKAQQCDLRSKSSELDSDGEIGLDKYNFVDKKHTKVAVDSESSDEYEFE